MTEPADSSHRSHDLTPDIVFALDTLIRVVERQSREQAGDFRASVLLVSDDGQRVLDAAAPSLPDEYRRMIDGLVIGPAAGSCGTAAFRNQRVIVSDIEHDPLWAPYRDLALPFGFKACWSEPIRSSAGEVLGTFAMYYAEKRVPTVSDLQIISAAAKRAGDMLEQGRAGADRGALVAGLA